MTQRGGGPTFNRHSQDGLDNGIFDPFDLWTDVDLQVPNRTLPSHSDLGANSPAGIGASFQSGANGATPESVSGATDSSFGIGKITFVPDDDSGSPIPSPAIGQPSGQPNVPDVVATTGSGVTVTQAATHSDGSITETVTFAGSGIVFNNTFASGLSQAYINCALAAEQTIAGQWNNSVTINESFIAQAEGLNGDLASNNFYVYGVSYATLKSTLTTLASHEPGNTYLQQAVAHLPSSDPSGGAGFELALPYARMLGLTSVSESPDDIVTLNTSYNWSYGQDVINTLTHEISEGGMGRIGGLGDQNSFWSVMDLFRYNSSDVPDYTDGRDNRTTYFSYNGGATLSSLSFNNEYSGSTHVNNGDTADFTQLDVFGTGTPGETNTLSQTDIQIMEALGWTPAPQVVISVDTNSFGLTQLVEVGGQFALENSSGNGPHITLNGAPVLAGQLSPWSPIGAALTATGYEVAWQVGNSFMIWNTDSNGNYLSSSGTLSGTSTALEIYETGFHQDLNGDGTIGVTSTLIETNGTTSLVAVADQYALENSHGNGPHITLNGAPVVAGQLSPWSPIAAVQTATGYEVAWQVGNSFMIWNTDSNGNFLSSSGTLSGTSNALEIYETVFNRDFNGDGTIGVTSTLIETNGTTSLVAVADQYALENSQGNGPHITQNGAPVVAGQLNPWSPIAAVQTTTGYEVAWQVGDSFMIWNTDSNGNYLSSSGTLSGTSTALEIYETVFHHDLNGDGTIGVTSTPIESDGTTSLVAVADQYALENNQGNGPHITLNGAPVIAGQLSPWSPIAAVQTATGYEVAWQVGNSFMIWNTDSNGNYLSSSGTLSGTGTALEIYETAFHHDLNGDGTIGVTSTLIESDGTTSLVAVADQYAFEDSHGNGPHLQVNGVPVVAGQQLGPWVPVAAAQTVTGYEVAMQLGSSFVIWNTDSDGNFVSSSGSLSGTSTALESYETSFHHDLNGDGIIGIPPGGGAVAQTANASSGSTTFDGTTLTLGTPSAFNGQMIGFTGNGTTASSDQIDLRGLNYNSAHASFDSSSGTLSLGDGSTTASLHLLGQYSQDNFHFADDGNGGTLVIAAAPPGQNGIASQVSELAVQDTFVFAPNFGQVSLTNFAPATDTLQFSKSVFADTAALFAATHDDASGNAVITDAAHDTITLQHVTTAQLLTHQNDFHIV